MKARSRVDEGVRQLNYYQAAQIEVRLWDRQGQRGIPRKTRRQESEDKKIINTQYAIRNTQYVIRNVREEAGERDNGVNI
jgi:hypothetical protein